MFCDRAKNSLCVLAQKRSVEMKISGKELMLGRKSKQTVLFVVVKKKKKTQQFFSFAFISLRNKYRL